MNDLQLERDLRKQVISQKIDVYQKAMWSAKDVAVILDVTPSTARKYFNQVKSKIISEGASIEIHGKLPKEKLIKFFGISLEKEIKYYNLLKES